MNNDKEKGEISIDCKENEIEFEFSIADNGPRISTNPEPKIVEIFQSLQPKDRNENNGVGLSIVKKIVQDNGRQILCESDMGKGTKFTFTITK